MLIYLSSRHIKDCQPARETYSIPDGRALLSRLGLEGVITPTQGHLDDSVCIILDEQMLIAGALPGLA
jgi:hypothetical protein